MKPENVKQPNQEKTPEEIRKEEERRRQQGGNTGGKQGEQGGSFNQPGQERKE